MEKRSAYYKACRGNDAKFMHETNDCSVRAFAVAADITYAKSHALHRFVGRIDRKGTYRHQSAKVAEMLGGKRVEMARMTVARFIRENPVGAFWVARSGHAFAIVNGIVYDWAYGTSERSRVVVAYRMD